MQDHANNSNSALQRRVAGDRSILLILSLNALQFYPIILYLINICCTCL